MDKIVYKSKFVIIQYNADNGLYTSTYLPETENMRDEDWRKLIKESLVITDELKPKYILDDNRDRMYAYSPEIQEWTIDVLVDTWNKNGLKKYVQILPTDFINELSAQQLIEMGNLKFSKVFENTFVKTMEEAIAWLDIK